MASDVRIWNGTAWESIKGPKGDTGAPGPTVVSADAGNASRLGTDGRIFTPTATAGISQADADARYVNITGDTMTGGLTTTSITAGPARSVFSANNEQYGIGVKYAPAGGAVYFGAASASATPDAVISGAGGSPLMTLQNDGDVGIGTTNPQARLDVDGTAIVRGSTTINGNISSTGTAHSFAANSIAASAISGLPVAPAPASTPPLPDSSVAAVGTSAAYARADHVHPIQVAPRPLLTLNQVAYTFQLSDAEKTVMNVYSASNATLTIPADSTANFPIGTEIKIIDNSPFITRVAPAGGVTLLLQNTSAALTGTASRLVTATATGQTKFANIEGRFTQSRIIKIGPNQWGHFPT